MRRATHSLSLVGRLAAISMLIALLAVMLSGPARAADLKPALDDLASNDTTRASQAITALAAGGDDAALAILEALEADQLQFDAQGKPYVKTDDGIVDPVTGEPAEPAGTLQALVVNNVIRRSLRPALAQLRLQAKNVEVRRTAAGELAKRPTAELADTMRSALDTEKDSEVAVLLRLGLAQVDLQSDDKSRRLTALDTLKSNGDVSHKADLERLTATDSGGAFIEPDADIRSAAHLALKSIERRVMLISSVANLFYGLSLGSVLLLAALGLAITFGIMNVINMAHGEMLMIGAYATFVVQNVFSESLPGLQDWYLVAAIPVAFVSAALVGLALERTVIRFLYGRPLETLLATWGISLLLIQTVRLTFGAANVTVSNPSWLSGGWELMPTVVLPYSRIATILFAVIVVSFVWFLLRKTRLGLYVRAVTQNREMAGNMGIPTQRIDMWTFALGSGVAGLGGVALSQLGNVGPELGQGYIVDSFMVVVLGGVGNLAGTIFGATGLGLVNKFLEPVTGAVLGKIFILVLVILFIQKRPQGLFALKGRAAEL